MLIDGAEWRVKIGDLGLAKLIDLELASDSAESTDSTAPVSSSVMPLPASSASAVPSNAHSPLLKHKANAAPHDRSTSVVGTALYAPPRSEDVVSTTSGAGAGSTSSGNASNGGESARDLFALGVVLFEMWSRFSTAHQRVFELRRLHAERTCPREFADAYPAQAALVAALVAEPPWRRPSAAQLVAILTGSGDVAPALMSAGSSLPSSSPAMSVSLSWSGLASGPGPEDERVILTPAIVSLVRGEVTPVQAASAASASAPQTAPLCEICQAANREHEEALANMKSQSQLASPSPGATNDAETSQNTGTGVSASASSPATVAPANEAVMDASIDWRARAMALEAELGALRRQLAHLRAACSCGAASTLLASSSASSS